MKILVVDDNKMINESISSALKTFNFTVDSVYDGESAINYISSIEYDCVVLDIMMPNVDGYEVVKTIREKKINTPILFLSAKQSSEDRIKALLLGGDDFLVKPFSMKELIVRIQVLIKQRDNKTTLTYQVDDLSVDISSKVVKRGNQEISLSQKEYSILVYLLRNKNNILSREQILENIWDLDYDGSSNIVDVYINYLRKKIEVKDKRKIIETVFTRGYIIRD